MLSKASFATLVPVKNMKRAVKFYTESLGGKLNMKAEKEFASINIGKNQFWLIIPSKEEKRELAYSSFVVDDIKATVTELKKNGVKFEKAEKMGKKSKIEGPITYEEMMGAFAFFQDSESNMQMLYQSTQ
jgi:predicted enzyme related to lactoylglutathione lyase